MVFDPFRIGTVNTSVPVATPPAIDFDAFSVERKPQKVNTQHSTPSALLRSSAFEECFELA
jgi:hypothetical protein